MYTVLKEISFIKNKLLINLNQFSKTFLESKPLKNQICFQNLLIYQNHFPKLPSLQKSFPFITKTTWFSKTSWLGPNVVFWNFHPQSRQPSRIMATEYTLYKRNKPPGLTRFEKHSTNPVLPSIKMNLDHEYWHGPPILSLLPRLLARQKHGTISREFVFHPRAQPLLAQPTILVHFHIHNTIAIQNQQIQYFVPFEQCGKLLFYYPIFFPQITKLFSKFMRLK